MSIPAKDFRLRVVVPCRRVLDHGDLRPAFEKMAPIIRQGIARNFLNQGSVLGKWPPRKKAPWMGRDGQVHGAHQLLVLSGALFNAATDQGPGAVTHITPRTLGLGIDINAIPYWRAQNFGFAPRNLPARTFLIVDRQILAQCKAIAKAEISKQIKAAIRGH